MVILSQRDPRWRDLKMTPSNLTIGRFGCTSLTLAMLSDYFKCFVLPSAAIGINIKYTKDGLIIWNSVDYPNFKFEKRLYGLDKPAIDESLKNPNKAVILEVDKSHWVVCIGKDIFGNYRIADPWYGDKASIKRYGKVTGSSHFIKR